MSVKIELQNIISGNGEVRFGSTIQTINNYLRREKEAVSSTTNSEFKKANDYFHPELGIILEDLHDENVLTEGGVLQFIDTVFYLTPLFYMKE
jgi:hypothetical protein